jgi:hypothetical protein
VTGSADYSLTPMLCYVRPREDREGQPPESLTSHTVSAYNRSPREAHADIHIAESYTMAGTNPFSSAAAPGGHPIRIPPVRPLYAVAARGLGASMWFFVCCRPWIYLNRGPITDNSIHSSCSEHTTTARYFSASSTLGTTERALRDGKRIERRTRSAVTEPRAM